MKRHTILFAVLLGLCALAPARSKNEAQATLYTKVRGTEVYAAVVIRIDSGWYLYHTDLGHPKAIGAPTEFAFGGAEIAWGEVRMDAPKVKHVDDKYLGTYDFNYHTGRTTAYAKGKLAAGASLAGLELSISGQTCSESAGTCTDYEETVRSSGEGADRYWEGWPAELGPAPGAAAQAGGEGPEGAVQEGATEGDVGRPDPNQQVDPIGPPIPVDVTLDARPRVTGKLHVRADEAAGTARAAVVLRVAPGYHVYHGPDAEDVGTAPGLPTVVTIEGGGVEWGATQYPPGERHAEVDGSWSNIHEGEMRLLVDGLVSGPFDASGIRAQAEGLACDAKGCVPFEVTLEPLAGGDAEVFADLPAAEEEGGAEIGTDAGAVESVEPAAGPDAGGGALGTTQKSLLAYLGLAVLWGLITLLMPCTYPMIPITISYFTKQAMAREGKVLSLSLAYGGGIVLMFIVLGAVLGKPVQYFANHPVTQLVIGGLFLFFALVLWGVINLQPPRALMQMAGQASRKGGMAGVFLMGATLVVTSFSCTAPFVGDIIARGGALGWTRAILGMGVFGLTMAVPFVLLSLFPSRLQRMPSAGEWMHVLKVSLGFIEFAAAFKFLSGADLVWNLGMLPDELFLVVWLGTFLALSMFLLGWIRLKGESEHEIGPLRMASAVGSLIFTFYLGYGLLGFRMDPVMVSILPGYRAERAAGWGGGGGGETVRERIIVKDDLETAISSALAEKKFVLLNFTGFN